jgi:hypothetical protein
VWVLGTAVVAISPPAAKGWKREKAHFLVLHIIALVLVSHLVVCGVSYVLVVFVEEPVVMARWWSGDD